MSDINQDYYVMHCGTGKVPSPYCATAHSNFITYAKPVSYFYPARFESPGKKEANLPLMEAMEAPNFPIVSERIKRCLDFFDLYRIQLMPAIYVHSDNQEYAYWNLIAHNPIDAYDFEAGEYYSKKLRKNANYYKVHAETIRLDASKLKQFPLAKRQVFTVPGAISTLIVHKSVAEPLKALNASGLHLVPLLEWDDSFDMTV